MPAKAQQPYKITGIELISFALQPKPARAFSKADVEFNIRQEFNIDPRKGSVVVLTLIYLRETGKEEFLASIEVACAFELKNLEKLIRKADVAKGSNISKELDAALNRIAIATSRGLFYSHLSGSYLQDYFLPLHPDE